MQEYIPLSQRSPEMIRAQARLYQEMAATARTPEAKRGLEKLAVLMMTVADKRQAAQVRFRQKSHGMEMSNAAD